jgi:hypothetical protein
MRRAEVHAEIPIIKMFTIRSVDTRWLKIKVHYLGSILDIVIKYRGFKQSVEYLIAEITTVICRFPQRFQVAMVKVIRFVKSSQLLVMIQNVILVVIFILVAIFRGSSVVIC